MIQNERQYEVTKKKWESLARSLQEARQNPRADLPPPLQQAGCNGIEMLLHDLQVELDEYERLRHHGATTLPLPSVLDDLPMTLIRARVARGWSHRDLAQALGTTEQQVQRDESGGYAKATLQRLHRVADVLQVQITGKAKLSSGLSQPGTRRAAKKAVSK